MRSNYWLIALAFTGLTFAIAPAHGQINYDGGISVHGVGESAAKPDLIELDLKVSATAELTADAITKYRDAKRRALKAFQDLKLEDLAIEEIGITVGNETPNENVHQVIINGNPAPAGKSLVEITGPMRLSLSGIRSLSPEEALELVGKLLDTAKDAGVTVGPTAADIQHANMWGRQLNSSAVRFVVRDLDKHREAAYQKAVADARSRAERLARLHGVELGGVLGVSESEQGDDDSNAAMAVGWTGYPALSASRQPQLTSATFTDISFRVRLAVRFGIKGK